MTGSPHDAAIAAARAGISVLPPRQDGTKAPDCTGSHKWEGHQKKRAHRGQIDAWYADGRTGVGWVTGAISGDLEVIDFDDRSTLAEYRRVIEESGLSDLLARVEAGYFEHTPNGAHMAYRCSGIEGSRKLALRPMPDNKRKTLIETKGEGGFIIVAPSFGSVNTDGVYELVSGSISSIIEITPDERKSLIDVAVLFDEMPISVDNSPKREAERDGRPGDDYNDRVAWAEILQPHGWVSVSQRLGVTCWRRPDKKRGISATTNHAGSDLLYVFSTSTLFESNRGYSKFSVYAMLNHGSDFAAASRDLSYLGYGSRLEVPDREIDISGIIDSAPGSPREAPKRRGLTELLQVPGIVGEIAGWIVDSAIKPQPVLALGAAITIAGTILGQRVKTRTGLRTNTYNLGIGHTGSGKERARQVAKRLFAELGVDVMLGGSFASGSAVETGVGASPTCLYLIDEIGHLLASMKNGSAPGYVEEISKVFLEMYESSQSNYRKRTYADSKRNEEGESTIDGPCLSIYGTTVPVNFYRSITKEQLANGLLSRFLVFESDDPDPYVRYVDDDTLGPPVSVVEWCRHWLAPKESDGDFGPQPVTVQATAAAIGCFDALESEFRTLRTSERKQDADQGPYTRGWAMAQKLALIRACGIRPEPEITESDAQWACDLVWELTTRFVAKAKLVVSENQTEDSANRLLATIKRAGSKGVTKAKLGQVTRWLSKRQRDEQLDGLIESGDVVAEVSGDVGRPRTVYKV